uniref:Pro-Pol polyprotein n=1 Tax=Schizaphis graminum TaxID=13262 RepID=A0A2S2NTZ7_SCHGA
MGPLPTGRGGTHYILSILDTFSKFIKLYALKRATTKAIIKRLVEDNIPEVGTSDAIISDNGTQFTSKIWTAKLTELNIKTVFSTKYHPQSNPVERYNREIGRLLRIYCHDQHSKWPNFLEKIECWMNRMRSEITEATPMEILQGKKPENLIEKWIKFPLQPKDQNRKEMLCMIADRIKRKADKRETNQNKNKKFIKYEVGQKVLVRNHHLTNLHNREIRKLFNLFEGPFIIHKVISNKTLVIINQKTNKEELISVAEVRPYYTDKQATDQ